MTGISSAQAFTDSNLPIVIINTDINPDTSLPFDIPDDPRVLATMKIIKHPDGTRNYLTDESNAGYLDYNGRISIEIRGSSSQDFPKKPYGLTTLQADDSSNNNVSLLGMPSENDWVLNSLAYDPSLIRDYLSYNLARQMGDYAPRTQYCEVVLNSEYVGLYILQEKIKADSNRVNILKIAAADVATPNLTGGYITKAD
ncbi:MAG: secretion system protein Por, partial [Flavobacterium sp.]